MANTPGYYIPFSKLLWTPGIQPPPPPSQQPSYPKNVSFVFSNYAWQQPPLPPLPQLNVPAQSVLNSSLNPNQDFREPPQSTSKIDLKFLLNPLDIPVSPLEDVREPTSNIQDLQNLNSASRMPSELFNERGDISLLQASKKQSIEIFGDKNQPLDQVWSPEEDLHLRRAHFYWENAWQEISAHYFEGKRTPKDCLNRWNLLSHSVPYRHFHHNFDPSESPSRSPWSAEDDRKLKEGAEKCNKDWREVSALYFQGERTSWDCWIRWEGFTNLNNTENRIRSGLSRTVKSKNFQEEDTPALLNAIEQNFDTIDWLVFSNRFLGGKYAQRH